MIPLSLVVSFLLFPTYSLSVDPVHVPLVRRTLARRDTDVIHSMDALMFEADKLRVKYGVYNSSGLLPRRPKKRASSAGISITNQGMDASYFGSVQIGTPAQTFNVILDTGSSDLWLADSSCTGCSSSTPLFDPSKSSTIQSANSNSATTIHYGSGTVAGQIAQDTVSMGGFTINPQTFLAVDQLTDGLLDGSVSGIMGLAFDTIASTQATPFWQALAQGNQLSAQEMSFWLTRVGNTASTSTSSSTSQEAPGGVFTLGGTNSSLFSGDIEFLNMPGTQRSFWLLTMSSITVQGSPVQISTGNAALSAIDTGTTLIGGPTADVGAIWAAVPGSQAVQGMDGFFSFPCTTTVNITLSFGGKSWPINSNDMNLGRVSRSSSQCVGGIFDLSLGSNIASGSGNPSWVVGDTFLKNVYSVFRASPASVGFAQLSDAAGGSGTAAPSSASSTATSLLTSTPTSTGASSSFITTSSLLTSPAPHSPSSVVSSTSLGTPGAASGSSSGSGSTSNSGASSMQFASGAMLMGAATALIMSLL